MKIGTKSPENHWRDATHPQGARPPREGIRAGSTGLCWTKDRADAVDSVTDGGPRQSRPASRTTRRVRLRARRGSHGDARAPAQRRRHPGASATPWCSRNHRPTRGPPRRPDRSRWKLVDVGERGLAESRRAEDRLHGVLISESENGSRASGAGTSHLAAERPFDRHGPFVVLVLPPDQHHQAPGEPKRPATLANAATGSSKTSSRTD